MAQSHLHPNERAFPFLRVNERQTKPRMHGVTEIRGPYYTPMGKHYLQDILETMGSYVDILKFAGGSFALMPYHAVVELISLCHDHNVLVSTGGWALGMRAMMVTTRGEDYVTYADAKGLKGRTIFYDYAIRNALLPQATALALVLGQLVAGAVLVEVVFSYPGIGNVLFQGIQSGDFFLVQGIIFILILSIGLATLILDLIYPLLDPRITYKRG